VTEGGLATAYSVNDLKQYTSVAGIGLTYDGNGNLAAGPGFRAEGVASINASIASKVGGVGRGTAARDIGGRRVRLALRPASVPLASSVDSPAPPMHSLRRYEDGIERAEDAGRPGRES